MTFKSMNPFCERLKQIIMGPEYPDRFYVPSKYRYTDIYALSAGIRNAFFRTDKEETICFCVMDKGLVVAAFLAALTSPVTLVIPHSFSKSALFDMHQAIPFSRVITDQTISAPSGVETIVIDAGRMPATEFSCGIPRHPDSVFLKLFTGGSTGTPKIWSKTIRNMFGEALFLSEKFKICPDDLFAPTVPPIHIYGLLFTVLVPFVSSAAVQDEVVTFPAEIQRAISENFSTVLVGIPIVYRVLNGSGIKRNSLRLAFSSAGKLHQPDADAFFAQTGLGVTEIYGSTESGGVATRCGADGESHYMPYTCVDWKIEDNRLLVRSDFISPEIDRDAAGFIDMGDHARPEGKDGFHLTGRADRIVKVAGKRVDMDEIKNKIIQLADVTDAIVISSNSQTGRENEIWAVVEGKIEKNDLKQQLASNLEPHAIPRRIRIVHQIPVSSTGKYDKTVIEGIFQTGQGESAIA
jgi:acyl-coenzyme A synthetase/AMP-(fatty) acid ligase